MKERTYGRSAAGNRRDFPLLIVAKYEAIQSMDGARLVMGPRVIFPAMNPLVPQFALTPYLTPFPPDDNYQTPSVHGNDTLQTLFCGFESTLVNEPELIHMLEVMDQNIVHIFQLQSDRLESGVKPNLHGGAIGKFIPLLADPSVHLYSLVPIPKLDDLELKTLVTNCIQMTIAPDRSAWAIHHFVNRKEVNPEVLTNCLIGEPTFWHTDPYYFTKFAFELYKRNLLEHSKFIKWMITEMGTDHLSIFKEELRRTHSLLFFALSQTQKLIQFINQFRTSLALEKSQVIQFSILAYLRSGLPFESSLREFQTPLIKARAHAICELAQGRLPFASQIRRMLFMSYPCFNKEELQDEIQPLIRFYSEPELKKCAILLCSAILWFDHHLQGVSAIVAYLIQGILSFDHKTPIKFPLDSLIELLYEEAEQVEKFVCLFSELQYQKQFEYAEFLQTVVKLGYLFSRPEQTTLLLLNLPCASRLPQILTRLSACLTRLVPDNTFDADLQAIGNDLIGNIHIARGLPRVVKYQLAQWMVEYNQVDFATRAQVIVELDAWNLLVDLCRKLPCGRIPLVVVPAFNTLIPVFATHGFLSEFAAMVLSSPVCAARTEIVSFISEHFKQLVPLTQYRAAFLEVKKTIKAIAIDRPSIVKLVHKYSYFFGIHVLDAFFDVKTVQDFTSIFPLFFIDLFNFEMLTAETFFKFFVDFSESECIVRASHFFIKTMLSVILSTPDLINDDRCYCFFVDFFHQALVSRLVAPEQYLHTVLVIKKKQETRTPRHLQSAKKLIQVFIDIVERDPGFFSVNSILTETVVKGFNQTFQSDSAPLTSLLELLRTLDCPVITRDILKLFEVGANSGLPYIAALFSLLPDALHSPDFMDVLDFFRANVAQKTVSFWTLWLKLRPYYAPGFPVTIATPDREALTNYRGNLISAFSSLLFRASPTDERTKVHLNCWNLLCDNATISGAIADSLIDDLKMMRLSLYPMLIDFLHPALLLVSDRTFEAISDGFCKYSYDDAQFEMFARLSARIFAVYIHRFVGDEVHIPIIAEKLLEWIPKLWELQSNVLELAIDVFNFIIAFSNNNVDDDPFQDMLHERIKDRMKDIPKDVQNLLLLNQPRQVFKTVKDPLYSDYSGPDRDAGHGFSLGPTFSPDRNDTTGFSGGFDHSSLFNPFEEEFTSAWDWGGH